MLNKDLELSLNFAFKQARAKRHEFLTVEHLLLALLDNASVSEILRYCGANIDHLKTSLDKFINENTPIIPTGIEEVDTQPTLGFQRVLQRAVFQVQAAGKTEVMGANVLAAIFNEQDSQAVYLLQQENISRLEVMQYISHGLSKPGMDSSYSDEDASTEGTDSTPLAQFAINLNDKALLGEIDPLIGREEELLRTIQVLCRRRKNNPLFVGEAGVGKTAIAEGLAKLIVDGVAPEPIAHATVFALDLGSLLAGTKYRGDFEKRLKMVLRQLKNEPKAILFIDEIHTIIGAGAASGGVMDASNILKPLLSSGELRCMGATTYQEYRAIFEKDRALARRFQKIDIPEPSVSETVQILQGLKKRFENHHQVKYTQTALKAAAELSARYITDRFLPDKAIDVVDEAGAYQALQPVNKRKKTIGTTEVEQIISKMARIPSSSISSSDKERLRNLERDLKMLVFGQDDAIVALSNAIKLSRTGLREPQKPVGAFLFTGPTGVGKTEVTRQLARVLGIELVRFDMSEYMERHTVSRLIGAPPGYVGYEQAGLLTEAITKHPYAVLLLDEIEKAHPDIFNILLQVMDHGTLTDNNGRKADFRHVVIVMTSNAGADLLVKRSIGFVTQNHSSDAMETVKNIFPPEFRNRLDAVIQFQQLTQDIVIHVVDKFIMELEVQLEHKGVTLEVDQKARQWLAQHGYDEHLGARPMARLIQEQIKKPLAEELLFGQLAEGGWVGVTEANNELQFTVRKEKLDQPLVAT